MIRSLPAADGGEDGDLVAGAQSGGVAVGGFVAVDPDAGVVEHNGELGSVVGAEVGEQLAERDGVAFVVGTPRRFPGLCEQPDPDAQRGAPSMFVRAVGNASRRSGSIGSPVTSSMP